MYRSRGILLTGLAIVLVVIVLAVIIYAVDGGSVRYVFEPVGKAELGPVVQGNNAFAFDLYRRLKDGPAVEQNKGNLFFSPYSLSTALAMTYGGARGQTADQMKAVLHFIDDSAVLHRAFGTLGQTMDRAGSGNLQLYIANRLWGQKDYTFLDLTERCYGAELARVDFAHAREKARNIINDWVEDQTRDRIKDLIGPGILTELTRLVLTNAVYFKADWQHEFKKKDTHQGDFHVSKDTTVRAAMMRQTGTFGYMENDDIQVLELPYKDGQASMIVLLPKAAEGLGRLEESLHADMLAEVLDGLREEEVTVVLPKFEMSLDFRLDRVLADLGMVDAFSDAADFSGMDGTDMLCISAVVHQGFVKVGEKGTEAAGATGVVMALKSVRPSPLVFCADHPFVFFIRENGTGSLLFLGRVVEPME